MNTSTFRKFYLDKSVDGFFAEMRRMQRDETLNNFINYHTQEKLESFMRDIFPPPSLIEVWNAWDRKGRPAN